MNYFIALGGKKRFRTVLKIIEYIGILFISVSLCFKAVHWDITIGNAMLFFGHILLYLWYESCVCMVGGVMSMGVNFVICGVLSIRCMGCDGGCGAIRFIT